MINQDQIAGIIRVVIPVICTWLATRGFSMFGSAEVVAEITAAAIAIVAVSWSFLAHTDTAKLKSAAAIDPNIKIQVPRDLMASNKDIASLVHDDTVPNVTRADVVPKP